MNLINQGTVSMTLSCAGGGVGSPFGGSQGFLPITLSCAGGGVSPPFTAAQGCNGLTLQPGSTCPWTFRFAPSSPGAAGATSSSTCNGVELSVDLVGEAVLPSLVSEVAAVDFGYVVMGQSDAKIVRLVNRGASPVTLDCSDFVTTSPFATIPPSLGGTLFTNERVSLSHWFLPAEHGVSAGTASYSCNGVALEVDLVGYGRADIFEDGFERGGTSAWSAEAP